MNKLLNIDELRTHVEFLFKSNSIQSALFLASKLVTLSSRANDAFLLARIHLASGQPLLALTVLDQFHLLTKIHDDSYLSYVQLASQCYTLAHRPNEVLRLTHDIFTDIHASNTTSKEFTAELTDQFGESQLPLLSLLCLDRGMAFEHSDDRQQIILWYTRSLVLDCRTWETMERLQKLNLTQQEEALIWQEIQQATCDAPWLHALHACTLSKHQALSEDAPPAVGVLEFLQRDADLVSLQAETKYHQQRDAKGALELTSLILRDLLPASSSRHVLVHVACLVELSKLAELFQFAHLQVTQHPKDAVSWYCVGAYYYSAKRFAESKKYFNKASVMDPNMLEAFMGSAHALALNEESDRAITIYRTASRLFPANHAPLLGTAMEYLRTFNHALALQFCQAAYSLNASDAEVLNELGVVSYQTHEFSQASIWYRRALGVLGATMAHTARFETVMFNYAHALRREGEFDMAVEVLKQALALAPKNASGHAALGLTLHMRNQPVLAVECYHIALGLNSNDTMVLELMELALMDMSSQYQI